MSYERYPVAKRLYLLFKAKHLTSRIWVVWSDTRHAAKLYLFQAKERRHELQKLRALQSYYEAKCRRMKKIKSKK